MQNIIQFILNHPILNLTWLIIFITIILSTVEKWFYNINEINNHEAIHLINKLDAIIFDIRDYHNYCNGHIINSVNLNIKDIKLGNLNKLNNIKNRRIIIVSTTGSKAYYSAKKLIQFGFKQIYILKEGIYGWNKDHLPLIQEI